ncbi:MAG: hypothetical protein IKU60_03710 [Clostridia bacterium]|nr:hypothetical protein [Clostridia bacterium]
MKKTAALLMIFILCLSLTGCGEGVKIDPDEVIVGNGTWQITKGESVYTIIDNIVTKDEEVLYEIDNIKSYNLYALGEYLYVNTQEGAMQLKLDGSRMKKFGNGEVVAAGGKCLYYQSEDNKVGNMIVYKIDMTDGRQLNLFQDTITSVELIDHGVLLFNGVSGNQYVNEFDDDNGYFYEEWSENNHE